MNVYIYDNTDTRQYHVSSLPNNELIFKQGADIDSITFEGTYNPGSYSQLYIRLNTTTGDGIGAYGFVFDGATVGHKRQLQQHTGTETWTTYHESSSGVVTSSNTYKIVFTKENCVITFNGNTTTITYNSAEQSIIDSFFESSTPYTYLGSHETPSSWSCDITVGYTGTIEHELKNAYIGEYHKHREPGSNTLLYAPCKTDLKNVITGNTPSASSGSSLSGGHLYCNKGYCHWALPESYAQNQPFTVNCFFNVSGRDTYNWRIIKSEGMEVESTNNQNKSLWGITLGTIMNGGDNSTRKDWIIANCPNTSLNTRYNVCMTFDGTTAILYLNGVGLVVPIVNYASKTGNNTYCGCGTTGTYDKFYGYIGDIIFEKGAWEESRVIDRFNINKSNYGL